MLWQDWEQKGEYIELDIFRLFVVADQKKPENHLVFLHGFPTSSFDFYKVLPLLPTHFTYTIHDHVGFGLSSKPVGFSYSLRDQALLSLRLWGELGINKVHIIAHDYGTSIATEILALREEGYEPVCIESVTLSNGSILIDQAELLPIQIMLKNRFIGPIVARLANRQTFSRNLHRITNSGSIADQEIRTMWHLLRTNQGKLRIPKISQYINERFTYLDRWVGALTRTDIPIFLVWGRHDPIANQSLALQLLDKKDTFELCWLDTGHYPMMEAPEQYASAIVRYLS